jgi:hypothetical protein
MSATSFQALKEALDGESPDCYGPLSDGDPPSVRKITDVIKHLLSTGEFNEDPQKINSGECEDFLMAMADMLPGVFEMDHLGHIFARIDNRYYDAEAPEGVDDWRDLPYFQRELGS